MAEDLAAHPERPPSRPRSGSDAAHCHGPEGSKAPQFQVADLEPASDSDAHTQAGGHVRRPHNHDGSQAQAQAQSPRSVSEVLLPGRSGSGSPHVHGASFTMPRHGPAAGDQAHHAWQADPLSLRAHHTPRLSLPLERSRSLPGNLKVFKLGRAQSESAVTRTFSGKAQARSRGEKLTAW